MLPRLLIDWRVIEVKENLTLCLRAGPRLIISLSVLAAVMQYGHFHFTVWSKSRKVRPYLIYHIFFVQPTL